MSEIKKFFDKTEDSVNKLKNEIVEDYLLKITDLEETEGINLCESPVERMLFLSLKHVLINNYGDYMYILTPQKKVDSGKKVYRADFVLNLASDVTNSAVEYVIEVDGHAFHEKTKAQVAKDKKRDRDLSRKFDGVLRFSGSEVYKNPIEVADEAVSIMRNKLFTKYKEKAAKEGVTNG